MTAKSRTIAQAEADCRAAWAAMPDAQYGVHIHHQQVAEQLREPIGSRITYIRAHKLEDEQVIRLDAMRPITAKQFEAHREAVAAAEGAYDEAVAPSRNAYYEAMAAAWKAYDEAVADAHSTICPNPDCPWANGSLFGGGQ